MLMPFSHNEEPEKYSSFKKRKFHDYEQKAKRLLTGINDLSLKPKDKLKLREELSLILSVPQHETPKVRINKQTKEVCEHTNKHYVVSFDSYYCRDCKRYID